MERCCQNELLVHAAAAGLDMAPKLINQHAARQAKNIVGSRMAGYHQFNSLYELLVEEEPDFLR